MRSLKEKEMRGRAGMTENCRPSELTDWVCEACAGGFPKQSDVSYKTRNSHLTPQLALRHTIILQRLEVRDAVTHSGSLPECQQHH